MKPGDVAHEHEQARAPVIIELLDGSWLGVFEADEAAAQELETWALVPEGPSDEASRAGDVWAQALEAGPLLYVMFAGVAGNAAWSVFPAAARFLTRRRRSDLDVTTVTARVRATAEESFGPSVTTGMTIRDIHRDGDGTWEATSDLAGGETGPARLTSDESVVRLTRGSLSAERCERGPVDGIAGGLDSGELGVPQRRSR